MADVKENQDFDTTVKSDFEEVVQDIGEELVARLTMDPDETIIDMFQTGSLDPWQLFVFYGALEKALLQYRTDKRKKSVIVHVQPEERVGIGRTVTPLSTLLEHILMARVEDMGEGRLDIGEMTYSGESIDYAGVTLKGRHVVLICDVVDIESEYLRECINLCKDMKASHVVAVPLMLWNPDLIDNLDEEEIAKALKNENRPLS